MNDYVCICEVLISSLLTQHAGLIEEAAKWVDEGRTLDTADRYVNSKCAKYTLRTNQVKKAEELCGLFTRVRQQFV